MSTTFTLIASGGSRFQADRQLLTADCATFAGILANGVDDPTTECQISEDQETVALFLEVLKGEKKDEFTSQQLRTLAELQKKYQSRLLHLVIMAEITYKQRDEYYESLVLAFIMEDTTLGRYLAGNRVANGCSKAGEAGDLDAQYDVFRRSHLIALRNALLDERPRFKAERFYDHSADEYGDLIVKGACVGEAMNRPGKLFEALAANLPCKGWVAKSAERMDKWFDDEVAKIPF